MSRRNKFSAEDAAYFQQKVEADIEASTRTIAAAEASAEERLAAMNALEELLPRRKRLRDIAAAAAAPAKSARKSTAKKKSGRKAPVVAAPAPLAAVPPSPPVNEIGDDDMDEGVRTWHLRIESAIRVGKLDPARVDRIIETATEGAFKNRLALTVDKASEETLAEVHRALLGHINQPGDGSGA